MLPNSETMSYSKLAVSAVAFAVREQHFGQVVPKAITGDRLSREPAAPKGLLTYAMLESPPKAYAVLLAERAAAGTALPTPRPRPRLHMGRRTTGLIGPPLSLLMAGRSMPESTAPRRWPATSAAHSATTRRPPGSGVHLILAD